MHPTNRSLVEALDKRLPFVFNDQFKNAVNFKESSEAAVHRWFRYREGFSPAILDAVGRGASLFDPFCGCGTTLIEGKRRGLHTIGTDVNPLAVFVAKTKTDTYSANDHRLFSQFFRSAIVKKNRRPTAAPQMPLLPKLFQPAALEELLSIKSVVESCPNQRVRNLLFLSWLNILEDCSNIFKEGNGIKYRNKKRFPGQYQTIPDRIWIPKYFGQSISDFVRQQWINQCEMVVQDLKGVVQRQEGSVKAIEGSCLDEQLMKSLPRVDACVFSPPYANRFDYFEAFKLEMWMGEFVKCAEELRALRKRSMRNNLTTEVGTYRTFDSLERLFPLMDPDSSSVRMGIQDTLRGYFEDVRILAEHLCRILRPGGRLVCVVGNSAYAGVLIPTDSLCAKVFGETGFKVEAINVARHLTVSAQQRSLIPITLQSAMRESVIVCTRQNTRKSSKPSRRYESKQKDVSI